MTVIVLAAGYAVRLQPLTLNTSKSLLPIGNKKIIDRILEKVLKVKGISSLYIITNSKFFKNFSEWLKTSKHKEKISIICDGTTNNENRLGAIKDLEFVIKEEYITGDIMVVAGDNLFEFDLNVFLKFAKKLDGVSIALRDIGSLELAKNFGVVKIDRDKRIVEFEEKPQNPKSTLISTGIYYFPKKKLPSIKEYLAGEAKRSDAPGYYVGWMSVHDTVYGLPFTGRWRDIGDIESYKKACQEYS